MLDRIVLVQTLPRGGIDDVNLTFVVGAVLTVVGGVTLLVETATLLYREYHGRTRYHRDRRTALRNTAIAATACLAGVAILYTAATNPHLP